MNSTIANIIKHPLSVLYGTLLLILAIKGFITELFSGALDAAIVDLSAGTDFDLGLAGVILTNNKNMRNGKSYHLCHKVTT